MKITITFFGKVITFAELFSKTMCALGHMTDCPAFLGVTLNSWPTTSPSSHPIVKYDVLVSCPPHLLLTLNVPAAARSDDANARDAAPNDTTCAFELVLDDLTTTHRVLLVNRQPPSINVVNNRLGELLKIQRSIGRFSTNDNEKVATSSLSDVVEELDGHQTIVVATFVAASMTMTSLVACIERSRTLKSVIARFTGVRKRARKSLKTSCDVKPKCEERQLQRKSSDRKYVSNGTCSLRRIAYAICVTSKVVYSLAFTFTVFFAIIDASMRPMVVNAYADVAQTCDLRPTGLRKRDDDSGSRAARGTDADRSSTSANGSIRAFAYQSHVISCLGEVAAAASLGELAARETFDRSRRKTGNEILFDSLVDGIDRQRAFVEQIYGNFTAILLSAAGKLADRQTRQLAAAQRVNWLLFPVSLFNLTAGEQTSSTTEVDSRRHFADSVVIGNSTSLVAAVEFGRFIDVLEPEVMQLAIDAFKFRCVLVNSLSSVLLILWHTALQFVIIITAFIYLFFVRRCSLYLALRQNAAG